jgi:hypothetical protein
MLKAHSTTPMKEAHKVEKMAENLISLHLGDKNIFGWC